MSLRAAADIIYANLIEMDGKIRDCLDKGIDSSAFYHPTAGLNQMWMLSAGYATETLIKTIIIATTTETIVKDHTLNRIIFGNSKGSHDLHSLLVKLEEHNINFSEDENSFIDKMTSYTVWRGKYPIPLKADDLYAYKSAAKGKVTVDLGAAKLHNDKDKKLFDNIFNSLYSTLQEVKKTKGEL